MPESTWEPKDVSNELVEREVRKLHNELFKEQVEELDYENDDNERWVVNGKYFYEIEEVHWEEDAWYIDFNVGLPGFSVVKDEEVS